MSEKEKPCYTCDSVCEDCPFLTIYKDKEKGDDDESI